MQFHRTQPTSDAAEMPAIGATGHAVQSALDRAAIRTMQQRFQADNEGLFQDAFFDPSWIQQNLARQAIDLIPQVHRSSVPGYKKSGSISYFDLQRLAPDFVDMYRSEPLRAFFADLAGVPLQRCPDRDPHACALYYYTEAGDRCGFHYDKSWYRGARYTVLIGLVQESNECLLHCHFHKDDPDRETREEAFSTGPGSLVFFNGNKLWHGVSAMGEGQRRIMLTLEYVTDPHMSAPKRWVSNLKDAVAYFGFKGVMRRDAAPSSRADAVPET